MRSQGSSAPEGNGVIVSQVVPFPWDTSLEVVGDYQAAQKAIDPTLTPDFVSLEGYLSGRLAAVALELIGPNPTRAALLQIINDIGRFDIGGNIITFGDKTREEPPKVFLTVIQPDGSFKPVDQLSRIPRRRWVCRSCFCGRAQPRNQRPTNHRIAAKRPMPACRTAARMPQDRVPTARNAIRTGQARSPLQSEPVRARNKRRGQR